MKPVTKWIYLSVAVFGFFVCQLFASNMNLLLIFPSFEVIDSMQDLYRFKRMKTITLSDDLDISDVKVRGNEIEKEIILQRENINKPDITSILEDLPFYLNLITEEKTHVFLGDGEYIEAIRTAKSQFELSRGSGFYDDLYVSKEHPNSVLFSMPYRKSLSRVISSELDSIVTTIFESGCFDFWVQEFTAFGGKLSKFLALMKPNDLLNRDKQESWKQFVRTLEHAFVAVLVLFYGLGLAFVVFLVEYLIYLVDFYKIINKHFSSSSKK